MESIVQDFFKEIEKQDDIHDQQACMTIILSNFYIFIILPPTTEKYVNGDKNMHIQFLAKKQVFEKIRGWNTGLMRAKLQLICFMNIQALFLKVEIRQLGGRNHIY